MGFLSAHTIPSLNHVIASPSSLHYHLQCGNNLFRWQLQFQFQYLQSSPLSTKYLTVLPSRLTCPLSLIQAFMKPHPSPLPLILHFQLYTKVKSSFYQNPAFRPIYYLIIYRCFKKHHLMSKVLTFFWWRETPVHAIHHHPYGHTASVFKILESFKLHICWCSCTDALQFNNFTSPSPFPGRWMVYTACCIAHAWLITDI